jgi:phosphoglycolate phosphatase-like HAD superfamily hydrolase
VPLPGLLDFKREEKRRGLALVLVTNAPEENVEAMLLALELEGFFDEVVLSDEVGSVKPDPAPETLEEVGAFMVAEDFAHTKLRNLLDLPGEKPEA